MTQSSSNAAAPEPDRDRQADMPRTGAQRQAANAAPDPESRPVAEQKPARAPEAETDTSPAGPATNAAPDPDRPAKGKAGAARGKKKAAAKAPPEPAPPPAGRARVRRRHRGVLLSLILFVAIPAAVSGWYLWERAADQYASTVAFSVRTEEVSSAIELLGGITELSGSSSSDTDILYEFIQSQKLVAEIDDELGLREIWSRPENDPVFAYDAPGTIEDLLDYWRRMVRVAYDSGTGLIEIRVLAFRPDEATAIATAIFRESSAMINALNDIAREDAIRYAREELDTAVERLKEARTAITAFRNRTQIVDPSVDMQTQAGLLGNLQAQLAEALIDLDLLSGATSGSDPRMRQAERRVEVIEARIAEERRKLGIGDGAERGEVFADLVGEYERLAVDLEFAQQSYTSALVAFDAAKADARRQSRYLAAHVLPTQAEKSQYPQRVLLLGLVALFLFLIWSVVVLIYYSLKDRR